MIHFFIHSFLYYYSYSSLRNLHFAFPVFSFFSFNIIIFFFLFTLSFFAEKLFFYVFFWYGLGTCHLLFFPFLLFYLFFLVLSTLGKILAKSHHKAPITTFSTIFSHREILLNRLPNGSKHIRFRYAQPLEDISSEWNPQPPCWDHQKLLWQLYLLCWWWWLLIWSRHWCQKWMRHVHIAFQSCCKLDHAAHHWGSV